MKQALQHGHPLGIISPNLLAADFLTLLDSDSETLTIK